MRSIAAAVLTIMLAAPATAGDGPEFWDCGDLWFNRNQIYKDAGYCFRTTRAIRAFGNAGCRFDDVDDLPLSASQRRAISEIVRYGFFAAKVGLVMLRHGHVTQA